MKLNPHHSVVAALALLAVLLAGRPAIAVQAVEIGQGNVEDLPGGREADGIVGDFVLRNDQVEVLVSGNLHERRANMGTLWDAPTPGCIYDFTFRGEANDQLTLFSPGQQKGRLSQVSIVKPGRDGEAVIRAELTAAAGGGVSRRHDYILRDGWRHVVVVSTYTNRSGKTAKIEPAPRWTGLTQAVAVQDTQTGLCQDPDDRIGYAYAGVEWTLAARGRAGTGEAAKAQPAKPGEIELEPGRSAGFAAALAIGRGAADAFGVIRALAAGAEARLFQGQVVDPEGRPVAGAVMHFAVPQTDKPLVAYTDQQGKYRLHMPDAAYRAVVKEIGRDDTAIDIKSGEDQVLRVGPRAGVRVTVTDAENRPLPCKVQFVGIEGTPNPDLGPIIRAHGCANQYHSENGSFHQGLPPGRYRLVITRGIEYDHHEREVQVEPGKTVEVEARLNRVVDTRGWVSCDFHNHTTESGDNFCGTPDRVINIAAEHIEFAPTTEHNRITTWQPHIDALGLSREIRTVHGLELTGGGPHLNAFPLPCVPHTQDNGAPTWDPDARISALKLRNMKGDRDARWVQLNHPNMTRYFNDLDGDKKADGGFVGLVPMIDGAEVYGNYILSHQRHYQHEWRGKTYERDNWPMLWLQMLNAGHRITTVATADAHEVTQGGVGGWRTYVPSGTDEPAKIDAAQIVANAKKGRVLVTTGPFVDVRTSDGKLPGDTIEGSRHVDLDVSVQCNTWTDIDRVVVLVNGRADPKCDFKRSEQPGLFTKDVVRFKRSIAVDLERDAHLVVVAVGEQMNLSTGYGTSWQSELPPIGYTNPIYADVDANGFEPNYDTLGHPYLDYGFEPGRRRSPR